MKTTSLFSTSILWLLLSTSILSAESNPDPFEEMIEEGKRQYALIQAHNAKSATVDDDIFIFSMTPGFLTDETWWIEGYDTATVDRQIVIDQGIYTTAQLEELNNRLKAFNAELNSSVQIYICLSATDKITIKDKPKEKFSQRSHSSFSSYLLNQLNEEQASRDYTNIEQRHRNAAYQILHDPSYPIGRTGQYAENANKFLIVQTLFDFKHDTGGDQKWAITESFESSDSTLNAVWPLLDDYIHFAREFDIYNIYPAYSHFNALNIFSQAAIDFFTGNVNSSYASSLMTLDIPNLDLYIDSAFYLNVETIPTEDYTAELQEEISAFAQLLLNAKQTQEQWSFNCEDRSSTYNYLSDDFHFIINRDDIQIGAASEATLKKLEHKLAFLKEMTCIDFYVIVKKSTVGINSTYWNVFAKEVYEEYLANGGEDHIVLVTVPYNELVNPSSPITTTYPTPGIHASDGLLDANLLLTQGAPIIRNTIDLVMAAYANLAKPYIQLTSIIPSAVEQDIWLDSLENLNIRGAQNIVDLKIRYDSLYHRQEIFRCDILAAADHGYYTAEEVLELYQGCDSLFIANALAHYNRGIDEYQNLTFDKNFIEKYLLKYHAPFSLYALSRNNDGLPDRWGDYFNDDEFAQYLYTDGIEVVYDGLAAIGVVASVFGVDFIPEAVTILVAAGFDDDACRASLVITGSATGLFIWGNTSTIITLGNRTFLSGQGVIFKSLGELTDPAHVAVALRLGRGSDATSLANKILGNNTAGINLWPKFLENDAALLKQLRSRGTTFAKAFVSNATNQPAAYQGILNLATANPNSGIAQTIFNTFHRILDKAPLTKLQAAPDAEVMAFFQYTARHLGSDAAMTTIGNSSKIFDVWQAIYRNSPELYDEFLNWPVTQTRQFYNDLVSSGLESGSTAVNELADFFVQVPGGMRVWERILDADVPVLMRKDVEVLEYLSRQRTNKIKLDVEEALGGHSITRHGSGIPIVEMEQRVLGTHPTLNQSRSALKFDDDAIHQISIDDAFNHYKSEIKAHFDAGGGYRTWGPFETGGRVGEGYHNYSTLSSPTATYVTTSKVSIAFRPDPDHPDGFMLDSAYPKFVPE